MGVRDAGREYHAIRKAVIRMIPPLIGINVLTGLVFASLRNFMTTYHIQVTALKISSESPLPGLPVGGVISALLWGNHD